ncbi:hypothetical protein OIDMADRAFT_142803 [Oidiodendron maius Zn]|uniref:Uncharacterized protein n=1 Tax=Oidiodendron maius (strain Zn) TaxID=913774 RepID=A0A0C3DSH8_OIDMZ|nr:hypothetical protein OIDMADRAFT_142803 [Oidiodendron maius Zn]
MVPDLALSGIWRRWSGALVQLGSEQSGLTLPFQASPGQSQTFLQLDNRAGLWHSMISVAPMTLVAKELVRRRTVTGTSSWLNPAKLAELKATGILDKEMDQLESDGKTGDSWPWIIKEVIESGPQRGEEYWVNYRQFPDGCANNKSPEDTKAGYLASAEARAARERKEAAERDARL